MSDSIKRLFSTVICPLVLLVAIIVLGTYQPTPGHTPKECCPGGHCDKPCCPDGKCDEKCQPPVKPVKVKPFVIAFGATWCTWCQKARPDLARIEAAGFEVTHIDIDRQADVAKKYGVTSVPTFFIHDADGKEIVTQDVQEVLAAFGLK